LRYDEVGCRTSAGPARLKGQRAASLRCSAAVNGLYLRRRHRIRDTGA
jgi:hypothetical protein